MIISASRRCDIPAHSMDQFMASIAAGYCLVANPFNAASIRRVALLPGEIDCIVFWTRDPRPLIPRIAELEDRGLRFYVQVTLTDYPRSLEPGTLKAEEGAAAIERLSERIGAERVIWRYDPIILARGEERSLDPDFHLGNFGALARRLSGKVQRVVISLLDEYRGTTARLARAGYSEVVYGSSRPSSIAAAPGLLPPEPYPRLLKGLARIATEAGIEIRACAESYDLEAFGIAKSACVDAELIGKLVGRDIGAAKDKGQRPSCGCAASVDIGRYGACTAGCAYCYARR